MMVYEILPNGEFEISDQEYELDFSDDEAIPQPPTVAPKHPEIDPVMIDAFLSTELSDLSEEDKRRLDDETRGIRQLPFHPLQNDPAFRNKSLKALQKELDNITFKPAYDEAQKHPNTYVNDPAFRLRFLRCKLFDPSAAAKMMIAFLQMLYKDYGPEVMKRPLRLNDVCTGDQNVSVYDLLPRGPCRKSCIKGGAMQILPFRDQFGRRIVFVSFYHALGEHPDLRVSNVNH
jgi:hypothetical protein